MNMMKKIAASTIAGAIARASALGMHKSKFLDGLLNF